LVTGGKIALGFPVFVPGLFDGGRLVGGVSTHIAANQLGEKDR
jgi:hypothetical protein